MKIINMLFTRRLNLLLLSRKAKYSMNWKAECHSVSRMGEDSCSIDASDSDTHRVISDSFRVINNFVSEKEELALLNEVERFLNRSRYEYDHWDNVRVTKF